MKVNGIIAEYNPFHNGHKYQLEQSKELTGADYTIVAISGNFMQRGIPAIANKYVRAQMALKNGADLVLEIPSFYSCASAEYFAMGGVSLLDRLGVCDHLCFGSELGTVEPLKEIADVLTAEPLAFQETLTKLVSLGVSYPSAREEAIKAYYVSENQSLCSEKDVTVSHADLSKILSSPNNILGIEYCKSLAKRSSSMTPVTVKRIGADYHDTDMNHVYASATGIREQIYRNDRTTHFSAQVPSSVYSLLTDHFSAYAPIDLNHFSSLLFSRLIQLEKEGYEQFFDVSQDLSNKIKKAIYKAASFRDLCSLLKSKNCTYTHISRSLLHILLDITNAEIAAYRAIDYVPYARVLGLKKDAAALLSSIKANTSIPLITKLADAEKILEENAYKMLQKDIQISHIYNLAEGISNGKSVRNEYSTSICLLR